MLPTCLITARCNGHFSVAQPDVAYFPSGMEAAAGSFKLVASSYDKLN